MRIVRMLSICILGAALVFTTAPTTTGQARLNVLACRDIQFQDRGAFGSSATPLGCGREFSTSVPYVVLYSEVAGVDQDFTFTWELLEPDDQVYARYRFRESPEPGYSWTYYFWDILPVSAIEKEILEKNPRFRGHIVEVGATPVSQKPGEWKLRISLSLGPSVTQRFTLKP